MPMKLVPKRIPSQHDLAYQQDLLDLRTRAARKGECYAIGGCQQLYDAEGNQFDDDPVWRSSM